MLAPEELRRYDGHIRLPEIGLEGQKKIKQGRVLVVGAGSSGTTVLMQLTRAGIGNLGIIDYGFVKERNLQNHQIFSFYDLGKHKTIVAKNKLEEFNPTINVRIWNIAFNEHFDTDVFDDYDIVVDGTDDIETKLLLCKACNEKNKPLVFSETNGFISKIAVIRHENDSSLNKYFEMHPPQRKEEVEEAHGFYSLASGLAGQLQTNEVIKLLTGTGHVYSDKILVVDIKNMHVTAKKL